MHSHAGAWEQYATDPGTVAADGSGRNGLFTAGLLTAFKGSDLTLGGVLTRASEEVERHSNQQQTPYINGPATVQKRFAFNMTSPTGMTDLQPSEVQPAPVTQPARRVSEEAPAPTPRPAARSGGFSDPTTGMDFVNVSGGCFQMGDNFGDGYDREKPVHEACVSDFAIGKHEVTQGEYKRIMGSNPSHFSSCGDNCPVEQVSWNDTQDFIRKLNSQSGRSYRLPSEAEWEYAERRQAREVQRR